MSRDVYAQYLMSLGHHQKARDQFKQAYDISCEVNGETDEQTLVLLNSLGKMFNPNRTGSLATWSTGGRGIFLYSSFLRLEEIAYLYFQVRYLQQ